MSCDRCFQNDVGMACRKIFCPSHVSFGEGLARTLVVAFLTLLLIVGALVPGGMGVVRAWADEPTAEVFLSQSDPSVNTVFKVSGMLPGDAESEDILVEVSHHNQLTVWFQLALKEETGSLADALQVRIIDVATGETVCEGTVRQLDARGAMAIPLDATDGGHTELRWRVEASLPASAGNEHQATRCVIDLHWFIEDASEPEPTPSVPGSDQPPASDSDQSAANQSTANEDSSPLPQPISEMLSRTGDWAWIAFVACLIVAACSLIVTIIAARKSQAHHVDKRPGFGKKRVLLSTVVLVLALAVFAWALARSHTLLPDHTFETGTVSIDFNGGEPVFDDDRALEPGRTLVEDCTVTNTGSAACYFRVYARNISGVLPSSLDVTISDKATGTVLYEGGMAGLESKTACVASDILEPGQTQVLTAVVHMEEAAGNSYQNDAVTFDLCADATQVRNNEGREF